MNRRKSSDNRDMNAALNLRKEGLKIYTVGHTGSACGAAR